MEAKKNVLVKSVTQKMSNRGEIYFNVSLTEDTGIQNPVGGNFLRVWDNLYFPHKEGQESPLMLEGLKCDVTINFYPVTRTVGENNYTDIKCNIVKFE